MYSEELRDILETYPYNDLKGLVKKLNNKIRKEINRELADIAYDMRYERLINTKKIRTKQRLIDEMSKHDLEHYKIKPFKNLNYIHYCNFLEELENDQEKLI